MNLTKKSRKRFIVPAIIAGTLITGGIVACDSDADTVSRNISTDAEQFKIERRVVFYNGITDRYILDIQGRCSIEDDGHQLEVTCKEGPNAYKKHLLGESDNVTYFAEQLESTDANVYHTKIVWKPEAILPDINLETSLGSVG